jgi:hypothetical protein
LAPCGGLIFFVPCGCVFFFGPMRWGDFFLAKEVG